LRRPRLEVEITEGALIGRPDLIERYLDLIGVNGERRLYT
jgi:hypothetical protein